MSSTIPKKKNPTDNAAVRVKKKSPNRRLYDTQTSAYVTLSEIKALVISGQAFRVEDAKTSEDITRSILLQIILEEEMAGLPLFSEAALSNIIRFYGNNTQAALAKYLEQNMQVMVDFQSNVTEQAKAFTPAAYLEQSQTLLTQMQDQMLKAMGIKR